jgi:hypothetical protein
MLLEKHDGDRARQGRRACAPEDRLEIAAWLR